MEVNSKVQKMFNVLVLGGALSTSAFALEEIEDVKTECKIELKQNFTNRMGEKKIKLSCLDDVEKELTLEEVEEIFKLTRQDTCLTPFCNCWLG